MIFHVSNHSGVPPYLQIVQQVKQDIQLGLLKQGDQLPTVREVVTMLAINPNTVVKAYRELENQSFIEKRAGIGTFVTKQPAGPSPAVQAALLNRLDDWMAAAEAARLNEAAIEALMNAGLQNRRGKLYDTSHTN